VERGEVEGRDIGGEEEWRKDVEWREVRGKVKEEVKGKKKSK
jgi:hypothetical protein